MLMSYKAILQNNQLVWTDEQPDLRATATPVEVYVTVVGGQLRPEAEQSRRTALMMAALRQLAQLPERSIVDPMAWQREMRRDRDLPYRV
jgi:hypothetical protein